MPRLIGRVEAGLGDSGRWLTILQEEYLRLTGVHLYPGTLNLRLAEPWRTPEGGQRLEASDYGGTVSVGLTPCRVGGRAAWILRTDANEEGRGDHPLEVVAVAAEVRLRETLALVDGDLVELELAP